MVLGHRASVPAQRTVLALGGATFAGARVRQSYLSRQGRAGLRTSGRLKRQRGMVAARVRAGATVAQRPLHFRDSVPGVSSETVLQADQDSAVGKIFAACIGIKRPVCIGRQDRNASAQTFAKILDQGKR